MLQPRYPRKCRSAAFYPRSDSSTGSMPKRGRAGCFAGQASEYSETKIPVLLIGLPWHRLTISGIKGRGYRQLVPLVLLVNRLVPTHYGWTGKQSPLRGSFITYPNDLDRFDLRNWTTILVRERGANHFNAIKTPVVDALSERFRGLPPKQFNRFLA